MKDWIMGLCPEIAEWQAELIEEQMLSVLSAEREQCAALLDANAENCHEGSITYSVLKSNAAAIRERKAGL